jgi:hypothetical protein
VRRCPRHQPPANCQPRRHFSLPWARRPLLSVEEAGLSLGPTLMAMAGVTTAPLVVAITTTLGLDLPLGILARTGGPTSGVCPARELVLERPAIALVFSSNVNQVAFPFSCSRATSENSITGGQRALLLRLSEMIANTGNGRRFRTTLLICSGQGPRGRA